ncbi:heat shock 70 kDa protein 12B-like isoform X1 [Saccostrea echinata]|uniref:heat shock 70 kDa protein 12B-like isoform X1 n=1 Tax=Saccostrea echinata TaxID=191078 RepID=UPI002A83EF1B|nr:heat shock 70 kDa protein 12B-like isoform X1 [Saccostrea echinata]
MAGKGNPKKGGEQKREKLLVAAIDFGSTYSGYAFSFKNDFQTNPLKIYTNNWSSEQSGGISYKAPTTVLLNPDQTFHSFGYEAEDKYAELTEAEEHEGWYYFSRFKMKLMNALDISKDQTGSDRLFTELKRDMEIEDMDGKKMPYMTIIAHAIRYLKEHLLKQLKEKNLLGTITADGIFWVITVPAIWTDSAKQFTREAAIEAGIYDDQLMLAYEPEAAALYCRLLPIDKFESGGEHQELVLRTFERGKKFMVIDLGGGTVDITAQETTQKGEVKSISEVCGGPWGGTRVDEEFLQFLIKLVGAEVLNEFKDDCRSDYLDLMRTLEVKKRKVDSHSNHPVQIRIPPPLFEILEEKTECKISEIVKQSPYKTSLTCSNDKMKINISFFRTFFRNSLNDIITHLKVILQSPICEGLLGMVVVGGYAESPLVIDKLKKSFPGKRIIVPMEAGLAVAKGAVLYGHNPDIICSRVCRYTYGDDVCKPFIEGEHPYSNLTVFDKEKYCKNIFQKFFEKGEKVSLGERRTFTTEYDFRDKKREYQREEPLNIKVYVSKRKNPAFIYDVGCRVLGEITVECAKQKWPEEFTCTIEMEIGGTEIQVSAKMSTGDKATAKFDFL